MKLLFVFILLCSSAKATAQQILRVDLKIDTLPVHKIYDFENYISKNLGYSVDLNSSFDAFERVLHFNPDSGKFIIGLNPSTGLRFVLQIINDSTFVTESAKSKHIESENKLSGSCKFDDVFQEPKHSYFAMITPNVNYLRQQDILNSPYEITCILFLIDGKIIQATCSCGVIHNELEVDELLNIIHSADIIELWKCISSEIIADRPLETSTNISTKKIIIVNN